MNGVFDSYTQPQLAAALETLNGQLDRNRAEVLVELPAAVHLPTEDLRQVVAATSAHLRLLVQLIGEQEIG